MSSNGWERLVQDLRVWQRGDERAPHKPLLTLILLARAQRGESRAVPFAEIEEPLRAALVAFGPRRKAYHPEFPFWYLQNDGFWTIRDADRLPGRAGKAQPTKAALLAHHVVGEVPAELWMQLETDPALIRSLARRLLAEFWPETFHESIADHLGLDLGGPTDAEDDLEQPAGLSPRPVRSPLFRQEVLRAYERRCAVCGFDARLADTLFGLEAAHIKWFACGGPDEVPNGLALCALHHIAFDRGAITLDRDYRVRVSQDVTGSDAVSGAVLSFNGAQLTSPQTKAALPAGDFIDWHRKEVFRGPERALP